MQTHTTLGLRLHRSGSRDDRCDITYQNVQRPDDSRMLVLLDAAAPEVASHDAPDPVERWLDSVMAELDDATHTHTPSSTH